MPNGFLIAFWGLLGTAVGSFLNVAASRLPERRSILHPPSHCPACKRELSPADLVPIVSYIALGGRCRTCGARIPARSLLVELGTGLLFALATWRIDPTALQDALTLLLTSVYLSALVVITVTDLEHGLILNAVTFPAIGLALVSAALDGAASGGWSDVVYRIGGGVIGAGVIALIILLVPHGMGWGDAKLAGFIGLATGLPGVLFALFLGFVSGGLVAGSLLLSGRRQTGETIPLGPFLALGGTIVLLFERELIDGFQWLSAVI